MIYSIQTGRGFFLAKDKADFFQAVFSLVSYGNKTEPQYNIVCVSSPCNFWTK